MKRKAADQECNETSSKTDDKSIDRVREKRETNKKFQKCDRLWALCGMDPDIRQIWKTFSFCEPQAQDVGRKKKNEKHDAPAQVNIDCISSRQHQHGIQIDLWKGFKKNQVFQV